MKRRFAIGGILSVLFSIGHAAEYAVVIQEDLRADPAWNAVCEALVAKHPGAEVVTWKSAPDEALAELSQSYPKFTCFVTSSSAVGPDFVASVHRLTRRYDDDAYTDTRWGIVTGYDAEAALALAKFDQEIVVRKTSSGTEIALDMVEEAICYDELVAGKKTSKLDGVISNEECAVDTTRLLAETLTDWNADLFVASGHGFERGWQIGFSYRNGFFESSDGKIFGKDLEGNRFPIQSAHPRVYLPIGNCLIGCVTDENAFALAMMKSAGVKGMIGYTVPTWYGYAGWGCLDLFLEQPGRYTLNEAFLANHLALVHRLNTGFPQLAGENPEPGSMMRTNNPPTEAGTSLGLTPGDASGLLHDRDVVAYFGDPALEARMAPLACAYDQELTRDGDEYTFAVTGNRGDQSFTPVNKNGSQRGGRPFVAFLPKRIAAAEITEGAEWSPVIADDFILVPNPGAGERVVVKFTATEIE